MMAQALYHPHLPFYAPVLRCHLTIGTFILYTEEGNLNMVLVTEVNSEDGTLVVQRFANESYLGSMC